MQIYEESFPPSEREDADHLLARIAAGGCLGLVAESEGEIVGLAVLGELPVAGVRYLEYLAVSAGRRGAGIGGRLLGRATALGRIGTVWEVEPVASANDGERELRRRRVAFYERHGAVLVDAAPGYRAPAMDREGSLPYDLMWLPGPDGPPRLEGDLLRAVVRALLTSGYGRPEDDPLVSDVLARLPG